MSPSRRRTYRVLAVLIPLLVLSYGGTRYYESTRPVAPDLVGLDRTIAEKRLEQEDIGGGIERTQSGKRRVCDQRPAAGERASRVVFFVDCPVRGPSLSSRDAWISFIPIVIGLAFIFGGCSAVIVWANRRGLSPGFWPHAVLSIPVVVAGFAIMMLLEPLFV